MSYQPSMRLFIVIAHVLLAVMYRVESSLAFIPVTVDSNRLDTTTVDPPPATIVLSLRHSSSKSPTAERYSPPSVSMMRSMVATPPDVTETSPILSVAHTEGLTLRYISEVAGFFAFSFSLACATISWEHVTCSYVLPSRHRTMVTTLGPPATYSAWGIPTMYGMGFGVSERQLLLLQDEQQATGFSKQERDEALAIALIPSYNEVMLKHRTETLVQWKTKPTLVKTQEAIHTITSSLQTVWHLQDMANDYQWDVIRKQLRSSPLSDLSMAGSVLRQIQATDVTSSAGTSLLPEVVGFDWGSCAWRHCGAVADIQEAIDELDQLLGVLEPYEAVFCLDIVERSLRDILYSIPWASAGATPEDAHFYSTLPVYISKVMTGTDSNGDEMSSRIDTAYLEALQELRVD